MRNPEERQLAYRLHCDNLRSTLKRLVKTNFEIVLDIVLRDEDELQACLSILSTRRLYLVGVNAPLSTLEQRERERQDRGTGMAREQHNHPAFRRTYDVVIDTSSCTPIEGAAAIRNFINDHGPVKNYELN